MKRRILTQSLPGQGRKERKEAQSLFSYLKLLLLLF